MAKFFLIASGLLGAVGVAAGAVGAHTLKHRLSAEMMVMYDKATLYLLLHTLALFATALLLRAHPASWSLRGAGWLYLSGILLFCGSLLLISVTGHRPLPLLAPAGGLALIGAWLLVAVGAVADV